MRYGCGAISQYCARRGTDSAFVVQTRVLSVGARAGSALHRCPRSGMRLRTTYALSGTEVSYLLRTRSVLVQLICYALATRSPVLTAPYVDQDLDLDELLLLHKAWGDWFYSRPAPIEWHFFTHQKVTSTCMHLFMDQNGVVHTPSRTTKVTCMHILHTTQQTKKVAPNVHARSTKPISCSALSGTGKYHAAAKSSGNARLPGTNCTGALGYCL
eukprot:2559805-Rhodomonas_salina.3